MPNNARNAAVSASNYLTLVEPWSLGPSRVLAKTRVMTLKERWCASPDNPRKAGMYVYLDATPWVNVVAMTTDNHVVMIEQFRHGIGKVTLELAGGIVEHNEDHAIAGERELFEETGYKGTNHGIIGQVSANPASLNNMVSTVLMTGCSLAGDQQLDGNEQIAVRLVSVSDVPSLVSRGIIHHSLVVSALYHAHVWQIALKS
jgi:ADP-ribose pyrophosphatase